MYSQINIEMYVVLNGNCRVELSNIQSLKDLRYLVVSVDVNFNDFIFRDFFFFIPEGYPAFKPRTRTPYIILDSLY